MKTRQLPVGAVSAALALMILLAAIVFAAPAGALPRACVGPFNDNAAAVQGTVVVPAN